MPSSSGASRPLCGSYVRTVMRQGTCTIGRFSLIPRMLTMLAIALVFCSQVDALTMLPRKSNAQSH